MGGLTGERLNFIQCGYQTERRFSVDWNAIRTEYITTDIGYRDLSSKFGVSFNTLQKRAKKEDWPGLRRRISEETTTEVATAVVTAAVTANVDRARRIQNIADQLLDKIELTIDRIDGSRSNKAVKDVSDALKNVKDIMGIRSEYDLKEQELRLAKLRKETEPESDAKEMVIEIKGADPSWLK